MFHMKHQKSLFFIGILFFYQITHAHDQWAQIYKDKEVTIFIDSGSYFDPTGKVMLWAKNVIKDKVVYTQYQIQCKPKKAFRIMTVNAQNKQTKAPIAMQLGADIYELHSPPPKTPAEYIVNSVCGKH